MIWIKHIQTENVPFPIISTLCKTSENIYPLEQLYLSITVAAPLIAAASIQKIISGQLPAASIQERPLIKKCFSGTQRLT